MDNGEQPTGGAFPAVPRVERLAPAPAAEVAAADGGGAAPLAEAETAPLAEGGPVSLAEGGPAPTVEALRAPAPAEPSPTPQQVAVVRPWRERVRSVLERLDRPAWIFGAATLFVVVLWCGYYSRWPATPEFEAPVGYISGDPVAVLGTGKAFADLPPFWNLTVPRLNAPFGADWNDYPHSEKLLFYFMGIVHRFVSPGAAGNISLIFAHLTAAWAFLWVARKLGVATLTSFLGAMLYAFSPFMMGRALGHLLIAYVWHLPLLLFVLKRQDALAAAPGRRTWLWGAALMAASSWQHPYYTIMGLQLVALATFRSWLRKERVSLRYGAWLLFAGVAAVFLNQANVFLARFRFGQNEAISGRNLGEFLRWGLRIPDLFMPLSHPITAWEEFAEKHYFKAGNDVTENYFAFLGLVGVVLFVVLVFVALAKGFRGRAQELPLEAWVIGYTLLFAVAGGFNYLSASLGFMWLRSANRFSVLILCALLLWAVQHVGALRKPLARTAVQVTAALVGLGELFGMRPVDFPARLELLTKVTTSDRDFGRDLEAALPDGAAVFQLPVMDFPESVSINKMGDYEPFRPFLYTNDLRFSYGAHRGRRREAWQRHVERLLPKDMVSYLENHGFDAIVMNRRGFGDNGKGLEAAFRSLDLKPIAKSAVGDMVAYKLTRKAATLPLEYKSVALGEGFSSWETDANGRWSWTGGSAKLVLFTASPEPAPSTRYRVSFIIESLQERKLKVMSGGKRLTEVKLRPGSFDTISFEVKATGPETKIDLVTDVPGRHPPNGDPRILAFRVINPEVAGVPDQRPGKVR